ncbi:MAG: restriction endonuclease [Tepidisphaeraceae bacterium]|jgi:hypothetical protein
MRIPQDIANLLAVAIRDAIWFKRSVKSFLKDCGIPQPFLGQAQKQLDSQPTIKVIQFVLDKMDMAGDAGELPQRLMLTKLVKWKDFHSLKPEMQQRAKDSVMALREAYEHSEAEREYQQEEAERRMHSSRQDRGQMQALDHDKLTSFRDEFDSVWTLSDKKERGDRFQDLMNRVFAYYSEKSEGAFNRTGEQIDGLFYFDKHWWYVEVRWKADRASAADVSVLRDRAKDAFGGDTKALFVSFNGFSEDCVNSLTSRTDERVILMDGTDLRDVLDCLIAFDVLLAEKQADIVRSKCPFVSAREIIRRRAQS